MSTKERKWFVRQLKEEEAVLHEALKARTVAARRLLTNVIQQCAGKLESGIKQFIISSMSGDIMSENHQIDCHQVIYHVYHCAPQILSGAVPYITGGLLTDQLETRLKAVSLVGDLSYLPGSTISEAFQPISPEFLKRLTDRVVDVRMLAVQHVKSCKLQSNPFRAEAPEIISVLCDRLLDFDEKVRNQVVAVVYDVECQALNSIMLKTIKQVAERLQDKSARTVAARRLLTNVIQQCAGKLESGIKQFLISSMSGDIMSENHQIDCHQVIYHVYHCAPQILSGVVAYITGGLLTDQLETRLKAVGLVGDLSYLPGSTISEAFQPISPEFLKRLTDRVVDVRMLAVQHVKSCKLQSNPFRAEAPEIISVLCDRLLDFDEKVRNQVVAVVYDVECQALNSIMLKTIKQVAERLQDKSQAASCLSGLGQSPLSMLQSMQPLLNAILKPELLTHQDRDIKLLVATCERTRIIAPEAPNGDEVLEEIQNLTDINQMYHQTKARHLSMQQSDANSLTAYLEYILSCSIHALAHHSCPKIDDFKYAKAFEPIYWQLNLILSKFVHKDEAVKSESSSKVEKPLPFVSYAAAIGAAAAAEAMAAGLADPAGADLDDDDEGMITDDDLEGDADIEMEEGDDDNGDDDDNGGGLGVPVRMVGYGLHDFVTHINVQLLPTAAALDDQVRDELLHHPLPNSVHPPDQYDIIYVVQQGLHQEIGMSLEQMEDQVGWFQVPILLRRIVAQPILNPRWVDVVIFHAQEPAVPQVINQLDITRCDDADDLLIDLNVVLEQEFNIMEVQFHSTCIIDLPLHPNDERNLVEVGQIQPWIIAVQRILEIRVTIENNNGPPSPGTEDSMIED